MIRFLKWTVLVALIAVAGASLQEVFYENHGESRSIGSVGNGALENAYLMPYSGDNFRYFSALSYYVLNNGYVHSKVCHTLLDAYVECAETCPGVKFRVMECSDRRGGKMWIHRTHQNGMSVDFMVPKKNHRGQSRTFDRTGLWHYLLEFDDQGISSASDKIRIDFETMGKHIIALDNAAGKYGLRIQKVILKIELKDDLFATESGREVQRRGVYFAQALPPLVNNVHDDHYHVDFIEINK